MPKTEFYLIPGYIPTSLTDTVAWEFIPALMAAVAARDALAAHGSHVAEDLESFIPTINAYASVCVPADPAVVGVFGIPDTDAGDLVRVLDDGEADPFGRQVVRIYRSFSGPLTIQGLPFGIKFSEHDGQSLFHELDLHAQALGSADFADLFSTDRPAAEGIVADFAAGTAQPLDPETGSSSVLQLEHQIGNYIVQLAYYENYPEHRVRTNILGFGINGNPFYTDSPNQITAPNVRINDGATIVTGADYTNYPFPVRKVLEDQFKLSFLNWDDVGSEAAFTALMASYIDGSIIDTGA